jgi:hypothetical protein
MRKSTSILLGLVASTTTLGVAATAPAHALRPTDAAQHACVDRAGAKDVAGREPGHEPSAREKRAIARQTQQILETKGLTRHEVQRTSATVPVYVHKMLSSSGAGDVTQAQIDAQIDVLNADFAGEEAPGVAADTGFTFTLAGVDSYRNDTWHQDGDSENYRAKTRKGGKGALNIWLLDFDNLGIATFPWEYASKPAIDGIRVQYSSLPGGSSTNYDQGDTAVHEAGHWFGLYHTFSGGCTKRNDYVDDTPAQKSDSYGCPTGRDSCSLPGLDPIHNYMDYSFDSCYNQFTPGQSARMDTMWATYRA